MERRFLLFIVLSIAILVLYQGFLAPRPKPKKPPAAAAKKEVKDAGDGGQENGKAKPPNPVEEVAPEKPPDGAEKPAAEAPEDVPQEQPEIPPQWITLGSVDPEAEHRMLVTFTNKGGAVARIEVNDPKYHELDNRSGYIGHIVVDDSAIDEAVRGTGCPVQIVGPGTPVEAAGLKPGDLITAIDDRQITSPKSFAREMEQTKPDRDITLTIIREKATKNLTVTPRRIPLELIRPEGNDPLSFLLTLDRYDDRKLADQRKRDACLARLVDEMNVEKEDLRELDRSDLNMVDSEIRIPREGKPQWTPLLDRCRAALNAWIEIRGEEQGPLFPSSSDGLSRLPVERIRAIVEQLRDQGEGSPDGALFVEMDGLDLRTGNWELVPSGPDAVEFRRRLPKLGLEITKKYQLAKASEGKPAYHLLFDVNVRNIGGKTHKVAYQLDGPTGLPDEGAWYANKVSRTWSMAGLRDVIISFDQQTPDLITCSKIAKPKKKAKALIWQDQSITYIGVDAQYFSVVMIPEKEDPAAIWFAESRPIRVGPIEKKMLKKTDTSCRLISKTKTLEPGDEMGHRLTVFAGPKQPNLLAWYGLQDLIYYGWWWYAWLAVFMSHILHAFYAVVGNYGLAIIMLTILVRGCMFPMSRKQVLGMQKMQELQPELKKLQEKHKKDMEARTKAQQALFRKHNYNPLSGCLVIFVQLPIFIALYRSLMVDIQLRQAPLISQGIRWCSNLAAPDMLFNWSGFMPEFVSRGGPGILTLGPYFNLLPILTIALFIVQQKMFMPPPTDEQQATQQKMMKFMMVFMGFIFFKVASGLCIYFIASSLWGLAERKLMPKPKDRQPAEKTESRADAKAKARVQAQAEAKAREKRSGGRDGADRKKKNKKKSHGRR